MNAGTPYQGLRILDFTENLPGPLATRVFAQQGAEVWKVERPGFGDPGRSSAIFDFLNNGKSMVQLDLKSDDGRRAALALVESADVLVEGFRPGVMARFGLGPEAATTANPRLVYCSISGFGSTGTRRDEPCHDIVPLAIAGFLDQHRNAAGELLLEPPPGLVADVTSGLLAANGIQAALAVRARTGRGSFVDISMLDAAYLLNSFGIAESQHGGTASAPSSHYGVFACACGRALALGIAPHEDQFWRRLCEAVGLDGVADMSAGERATAHVQLRDRMRETFASRPMGHWQSVLATAGIPWAPVHTAEQAIAEAGSVPVPGLPGATVPLGFGGGEVSSSAGRPGADTAAVLGNVDGSYSYAVQSRKDDLPR